MQFTSNFANLLMLLSGEHNQATHSAIALISQRKLSFVSQYTLKFVLILTCIFTVF
jgi:hypothetical protein